MSNQDKPRGISAGPNQDSQDELSYTLEDVRMFLCGEAKMDGVWFGEKHRSGKAFWWRKHFRLAVQHAKEQSEKAVIEARKEAYEDVASKAGNGVTVRRYAKTRAFQHAFELTKGDGHE